jgi:hypothetical protein
VPGGISDSLLGSIALKENYKGGNDKSTVDYIVLSVPIPILAHMVNNILCGLHGISDFIHRSYHLCHLFMCDQHVVQSPFQQTYQLIADRPYIRANTIEMIFNIGAKCSHARVL